MIVSRFSTGKDAYGMINSIATSMICPFLFLFKPVNFPAPKIIIGVATGSFFPDPFYIFREFGIWVVFDECHQNFSLCVG